MPLSNGKDDQIGRIAETNWNSVRAGGAFENAAARLSVTLSLRQVDQALQRYRPASRLTWTLKEPGSIHEKHFDPWYLGLDPSDRLSHSYKKHLKEKDWDADAIKDVDEVLTRVVSLLDPSGKTQSRIYGLVLNHAQRGKTASFMAVIAKAVDVGSSAALRVDAVLWLTI